MAITQFVCPRTEVILRGQGALGGLPAALAQTGITRVFLVSTPSLECAGLVDTLRGVLGDACIGSFTGASAHTPETVVAECVEAMRGAGADGVISFGGSSVVDLAKSSLMTLAEGNDYPNMKISFSPETGPVMKPLAAPKLPHVAIPTTLSSSEFTFATVVTDTKAGEKNLFADPKLTPKVVIQDTALTKATPVDLWQSSGMKLICDCVESLCSPRANPFNDAVGIAGLKLLSANLAASADPDNHTAREACFEAGYMGLGFALNSGIGMVAALRHQLGANQGVGHGIGSTIMLPHVLRYNAPNIESPLTHIAQAMGAEAPGPEAAIAALEGLIASLNLPTRLRDVGVDQRAFQSIAAHTAGDIAMASNPRTADADAIEGVLNAAW